ncbi:hypothetical protein, partial [Candidatus Finniella inopinata]|uniref:hypothetical protein n=1 Tax=Candidatus Finniella inopinata TaxID=1696036 RepID=UPI001A91F30E
SPFELNRNGHSDKTRIAVRIRRNTQPTATIKKKVLWKNTLKIRNLSLTANITTFIIMEMKRRVSSLSPRIFVLSRDTLQVGF